MRGVQERGIRQEERREGYPRSVKIYTQNQETKELPTYKTCPTLIGMFSLVVKLNRVKSCLRQGVSSGALRKRFR